MSNEEAVPHGERPGCEGVLLPPELAQMPDPGTWQHGTWRAGLREFAASYDGGGIPMTIIDDVQPGSCPGCGQDVVFITTK